MNVIVTSGLNPRAVKGNNLPPEQIDEVEPTPFEMSEVTIGDLYAEAKNWLDGEPITSQAMADEVSKLIEKLRAEAAVAEERRVTEKKPFDDGAAEVQSRYNRLIENNAKAKRYGKAWLAINLAKDALAPWLKKLEDEQKAAAEKARKEADEKLRIAQEALRASQVADLEKREQAEALIREAEKAEANATRAESAKAHAKGGARAIGLRSVWKATMTDGRAAAAHYWQTRRADVDAFFQGLADAEVHSGKRSIPGFEITEQRVL